MSLNFVQASNIQAEDIVVKYPIFYELARDLETLELLVKNGDFYVVSKNEAIKIWILKTLNIQTSRYEYRAYSSDYGNEISKLFGRSLKKSLLKSELKRYIEEALLVNPYIKSIGNFNFEKNGSVVDVTFMVSTLYGDFEQTIGYEN